MASYATSYQNTHVNFKVGDNERLGFFRKVYSILSAQLLLTTVIVGFACASSTFERALLGNSWLIGLSGVGTLGTSLAMFFFPKLTHQVPTNYYLLGVFTVCEAILVSATCVQYDTTSVFVAALMTCSVTLALTAYAYTTKRDFSQATGILVVISMACLLFTIFMPFLMRSALMQLVYCCVFTVVYGVYIIIDTQHILGGGQHKLSTDDYILGSLILYIDIIGLFLQLLRLLGEKEKDKRRS